MVVCVLGEDSLSEPKANNNTNVSGDRLSKIQHFQTTSLKYCAYANLTQLYRKKFIQIVLVTWQKWSKLPCKVKFFIFVDLWPISLSNNCSPWYSLCSSNIVLGILRLMLGLMLPTWFLSMWMSNTATAAMMVPILTAILAQIKTVKQQG